MEKLKREKLKGSIYKRFEEQHSEELAEKVFRRYQNGLGVRYLFKRHNNKIIDYISGNGIDLKSKSLLEIGCGFEDFLNQAQKIVRDVYGVDISFRQLQMTKKISLLNILLADGECLPFKNRCFDFIVMKGVVHHLGNPHKVFKEVKRLLKEGGKLIIFEGDPSSWYRRCILKLADILKIEHESSFFTHLTLIQIKEILNKEGFYVENKKISGLFAPLGLVGFGNENLWVMLNEIEYFIEKTPFLCGTIWLLLHVQINLKNMLR